MTSWSGVVGVLALVAVLFSGCSRLAPVQDAPSTTLAAPIALQNVVDGLNEPVFATEVPDGSGRLAVVEQGGLVRAVRDGRLEKVLLDLGDKVRSGGEQGLLGLAFDPGFGDASDPHGGELYVDYTDLNGDTVVERYRMAQGSFDGVTGERVLYIHQPYPNHNGGMLGFGPDGFLYIGMGDGGSGGDPDNRAQDTHDLLGKILRIDVHGVTLDDTYRPLKAYAIPSDNPFADGKAGAPEVWDYGLRNPWRFSFDRDTGDLWIGDVGQSAREEIDMEPAGSGGGKNYGWSAWEGTHRYEEGRDAPGAIPPVFDYSQSVGNSCAVTGGYVYRGSALPELVGTYLFSDYCSGQLWGLHKTDTKWDGGVLLDTGQKIVSLGEDLAGELYVVDLGGTISKVVAG